MSKKDFEEKNWHRLDNTAKIFPIITSKKSSNVFRVCVALNSIILEDKLQLALDKTLPWFKVFRVKLKKGFFWFYFETNNKQAKIHEEDRYPCSYMNFRGKDKFLFKVTYYKKRINLEVFHSLSDASGAIDFLKALTYNYIKLVKSVDKDVLDELIPDIDCTLDVEDSYIKNYKKTNINIKENKKAYTIKDKKLPLFFISAISAHIDTDELLALCHAKEVTITEYVTAVLIYSIYSEYQSHTKSKKPIKIFIPVNLRNYFDSTTTMNFFSNISVNVDCFKENYSFDEILKIVKNEFKSNLTKENLSKKIANNVSTEKNIFIRLAPLFIKTLGVKIAYMTVKHDHTSTISNIGKIDIEDEFKNDIDYFSLVLSPSVEEPIKCSICTCGKNLVFTFSSILESTYVERAFIRKLANDNISINVESNGLYNEEM
ncbi:MAG: hypothetical protein RSB76_01975 [Clostridia bacterium]